jgi:hypothetical protein
MAVTNDIRLWRYGAQEGNQAVAYPVGATQQLYQGCVALVSGGTGATAGMLKNAASPAASDLVAGMVGPPAGGTYVATGPGILGGASDNLVWDDVQTGAFMFIGTGSGISGATAVTEASVGKTVYYAGEVAAGPVVSASSNSAAFPALGILLPQDPGFSGGFLPGSTYWPVKLNTIGGP